METSGIQKILIVEDRIVGFFSGMNVILGALARLSQLGFTRDQYSFLWSNRLYQTNNENLFEKYFFKNHENSGCTHSIKAINIGLPADFFLNEESRHLMHDILVKNAYFSNEIYQQIKASSIITGQTLGVHIRGTDHTMHGKILGIDAIIKNINYELNHFQYENIFVATDESANLNLLIRQYGTKIIYNQKITRSENRNAIHFSNYEDREKLATDVLLDCISLSSCHKILITSSNVSSFALVLNKNLMYHYMDKHVAYQ
jgi:hypothetical protein